MTVYTVHVQGQNAEDAVFVPEGFSWGAFLFTPFWLLWRGLWLAFLVWCAAMAFLFTVPLGLSLFAKELAALLIAFLCGLEGRQWCRQKLLRHGSPVTGIVTADTQADAEINFFHRWMENGAAALEAAPQRSAPATHSTVSEPVFGLFPEPENRP